MGKFPRVTLFYNWSHVKLHSEIVFRKCFNLGQFYKLYISVYNEQLLFIDNNINNNDIYNGF